MLYCQEHSGFRTTGVWRLKQEDGSLQTKFTEVKLCNELQKHQDNQAQGHYDDVIMGAMTSQITSLTIAYSTVYSDADQRKHQSSASLAFVRGILCTYGQ